MTQDQIQPPRVTSGGGYPWYYALYLQVCTWLFRSMVHRMTGTGELFDKNVLIPTPGLGHGSVRCLACIPSQLSQGNRAVPLLLVLEGGGFVLGEPSDGERHDRMLSDELGAVVLSVDYAKAPRFPYPHALLQVYEVLKWALSASATEELGVTIDPRKIAMMGNSAGGNLVAAISLLCSFELGPCSHYRRGLPREFRQVAQVLLYPSVACHKPYAARHRCVEESFQARSIPVWVAEMMEAAYLPPTVDKDQIFIAPVLAVDRTLESLAPQVPPVIFILAGDCLKPEAAKYAKSLSKAGVKVSVHEYDDCIHGFTHYKAGHKAYRGDNVKDAWDTVIRFLRERFH